MIKVFNALALEFLHIQVMLTVMSIRSKTAGEYPTRSA